MMRTKMRRRAVPPFRLYFDPYGGPDGGAVGSYGVNLNTNVTTSSDLSPEMRTYYSDYMLDEMEAELVHEQFAQKHPIPKNGGKTINFRKIDPLPELTTPLVEGITPDGQSLTASQVEATIEQYGGYVTLSDLLMLTATDPMLTVATQRIASQAGRTRDTLVRDVMAAGTNVRYAGGVVTSRAALAYTSAESNNNITVDDIKRVVRDMEADEVPKINGKYVGIIHPDVKYDLMNDPLWLNPKQYVDTAGIYNNEIGELYGVRFVEASRAKVWKADPLTKDAKTLTVKTAIESSTTTVAVKEAITADDATALAGRKAMLGASEVTISSATAGAAGSATLTLSTAVSSVAANTVIWPEGAGLYGVDVYGTLILGADAYGITDVDGGIKHIVKQLGSAGSADPMNQRSTVAWKMNMVTKRLIEKYMRRIESTATP